LVAANLMAGLIQYQSAKLGLVTGQSLPELLGQRMRRLPRIGFWVQAELIAGATDLAEVIGGAIALYLLFGLPLVLGGVVVGGVSMILLGVQSWFGQRPFEFVIIGLLAIIAIGFLAGLVVRPPDGAAVLGGLVPRFADTGSILLAASVLGATVMPHAIYVHSALARDRHGRAVGATQTGRLLRITRWDVTIALTLAGIVNIGMLLLAATNLRDVHGVDTIEGAHAAIEAALGPVIAVVFSIGLLASGLASTSVGSYAGATIMAGLLRRRIPILVRRSITLIPALLLLWLGADPTAVLVISQVALSFGIPFALIPLLRFTNDPRVMGDFANTLAVKILLFVSIVLVIGLNLTLLVLAVAGGA
jgi:manganese transport protein